MLTKEERDELRARAAPVADNDTSDGDWAEIVVRLLDALDEMEAERDAALSRAEVATGAWETLSERAKALERERAEARRFAELLRDRCVLADYPDTPPPLPWDCEARASAGHITITTPTDDRMMHDNCVLCGQAVCGREGESYAVPGGVERVVQNYCLERMQVVADKQLAVNALEADGIEVVDSTGCFVDRWALRYAAAEHTEQPPQSVWRPHPDGGLVTEVDGDEWRIEPSSRGSAWRVVPPHPDADCYTAGSAIHAMRVAWQQAVGLRFGVDAPPEWTTLPEGWEP